MAEKFVIMSKGLRTLPTASRTSCPNVHIPPIVLSSFPYRMAVISRYKLQEEGSSKSPDLRHYVGHSSLHRRSMQEAQIDLTKRMASTPSGDDGADDNTNSASRSNEPPKVHTQNPRSHSFTKSVRAMAHRRHLGSHSQKPHGDREVTRKTLNDHTVTPLSIPQRISPGKHSVISKSRKCATKRVSMKKFLHIQGHRIHIHLTH